MHTITLEQAEEVAASWRGGATKVEGWASPAGPLFSSGDYAEIDITMAPMVAGTCGTNCTMSCVESQIVRYCC